MTFTIFEACALMLQTYNQSVENIGGVECIYTTAHGGVLTFRGTSDWEDMKDNIQVHKRSVPTPYGELQVHAGVYSQIASFLQEWDGRPVSYIVGHSLGGGLAILLSALWDLPCCTFGAMRVFGPADAQKVKHLHTRVHYRGDLVPYLPPYWTPTRWFFGVPIWWTRYSLRDGLRIKVGNKKRLKKNHLPSSYMEGVEFTDEILVEVRN